MRNRFRESRLHCKFLARCCLRSPKNPCETVPARAGVIVHSNTCHCLDPGIAPVRVGKHVGRDPDLANTWGPTVVRDLAYCLGGGVFCGPLFVLRPFFFWWWGRGMDSLCFHRKTSILTMLSQENRCFLYIFIATASIFGAGVTYCSHRKLRSLSHSDPQPNFGVTWPPESTFGFTPT